MGPTATRTGTLRPVHPTAVAILLLALASVARADLTASYDGYEAVQFGQESMPPFPSLDVDRIAKIIAWVRAPCGG